MNKKNENRICRIHAESLSSMEYYHENDNYTQVLKDISFSAYSGECWGVTGNYIFEIRLFLEICANARPYESGKCILNERGMMRKKKIILPHVYYIGSTSMLFNNMTVLEYLMFITAKTDTHPVKRQKLLLTWLVDIDLGYISLTNIASISPTERSVVTLLAAICTKSDIIIWNLPRLTYSDSLIKTIKKISNYIIDNDKTFLFSSIDMNLMI